MICLASVENEVFAALVEQPFQVQAGEEILTLVLVEAKQYHHPAPDGKRLPFSLLFRSTPGLRLSQGVYAFQHPQTGPFEIFITQVGDGNEGSLFEAVFN